MKSFTRSIAVTAAVLASSSAFAIDSSTVAPGNQLYISGATATNQALYQINLLASNGSCEPGTIDVYIDTAGPGAIDADDQFMVACNGRTGSAFAGQGILLAKESNGGSNNGTRNVARAPADAAFELAFLDASSPGCDAPVTVAASGALAEYELHANCSNTVSRVPDAGIADVEAALFLTTTPADIAILNPQPLFQIVFAPAVSLNLRNELQAAQGLIVGSEDPSQVPLITRGQLHRIYAGEAFTWNEFQTNTGADFIGGDDVYVCRRGNDSGTQAAFAAFMMNERCNATVPGFFPPDTGTCEAGGCDWAQDLDSNGVPDFAGDFIFAGDGSGDVRACLDYRNDNGQYAVGVLSTNTTVNDTDRQIRFVGLDGADPTLASVGNGGFPFVVENVLNIRGSGPSGVAGDIVDFIIDNIGEPGIISDLNVGSRNPGGDTGILGRANGVTIFENAPPVSEAAMRSNPVSSFSMSVSLSSNNCQPASATRDSQIIGGGL